MELTPRKINITTAILLLVYRGIVIVFEHDYSRDSWINLFIPIFFLIIFFLNRKTLDGMFYTLVAMVMMLLGRYENINGAIFLFLSVYDNKKRWNLYLNLGMFLGALAFKPYLYVPMEDTSSIFSYIIGLLFVFGHLYVRFWPISEVRQHIGLGRGLTVEQLQAVDKMVEGRSHKDAAKELGISRTGYSMRLSGLREKYHVENDSQLTISLIKDGIISLNPLTNANMDQKALTE